MSTSGSRATAFGAIGMTFVGGSVAVSGVLDDAPLFTVQGLRYALACALLLGWVRLTGRRLHRPRGIEWCWLVGVAITGLVVFNVALVEGAAHAEPAVLAVAVAGVPVALALAGPLLEGHRPATSVVAAAVVVTVGAVVVEGVGRCDGVGLIWAVVVFVCEACFTLLAVPVLGRHGPEGVSVHTTWIAAVMFLAVGVVVDEGSAATSEHAFAIAYLAVGVTATAFVLWYSCVRRLGPARAGLLTGVAPVAAAAIGMALTGEVPAVGVWIGIGVIAAGLAMGFRRHRTPVPVG